MRVQKLAAAVVRSLWIAGLVTPALGGVVVFEEGAKKVEIGGRIQPQYVSVNPDCPAAAPCFINTALDTTNSTFDEFDFRRLRPYLAGTVTEDWLGKIEFDFGESIDGDEVQIKDAFAAYSGLGHGLKLTFGNAKGFFSREFITSSAKLTMIERSFVGDHNFGSPDRGLGVKLGGTGASKKVGYGVSLGVASHDPDSNRMDFDTPVNSQADWNDGTLVTGRVDFHPLGEVKFEQVDFAGEAFRIMASLGAFWWENDGDNDSYIDPATGTTVVQTGPVIKTDLDQADGLEASVAFRGHGFSADAAYHRVGGETVDPIFTGGVYLGGSADLDMLALTAGYLVVGDQLEVTAAWDSLDADNYADEFERTTLGVNWYLQQHDLKFQANYRFVRNFLGLANQDQEVLLASMQFAF